MEEIDIDKKLAELNKQLEVVEDVKEEIEEVEEEIEEVEAPKPKVFKKYYPEMCDQIINYMASGMGRYEVSKNLGLSYTSFLRYEQEIPEFKEALKDGDALARAWWEEQGRVNLLIEDRFTKFNTSLWVFNMKNRFAWRDVTEITQKNDDSVPIKLDLSKMSDLDLKRLEKQVENGDARKYLKIVRKK